MAKKKKPKVKGPMLLSSAVIHLDQADDVKQFLREKYNMDIPEVDTLSVHFRCCTDYKVRAPHQCGSIVRRPGK